MSKSHKQRLDVFVVLRADLFHGTEASVETLISAKAVYPSQTVARQEAERLNALRSDGRVHYWVCHSRFFNLAGSAADTDSVRVLRTRTPQLAALLRASQLVQRVVADTMEFRTFVDDYANYYHAAALDGHEGDTGITSVFPDAAEFHRRAQENILDLVYLHAPRDAVYEGAGRISADEALSQLRALAQSADLDSIVQRLQMAYGPAEVE